MKQNKTTGIATNTYIKGAVDHHKSIMGDINGNDIEFIVGMTDETSWDFCLKHCLISTAKKQIKK